jgi:acyl carrier protein
VIADGRLNAPGGLLGPGQGAATVRAWLIAELAARSRRDPGSITDETPLADGGLCLDSIALVDVIMAMETALGVTVVEAEVTDEHFGTVGRLVAFVSRKRAWPPARAADGHSH